MECLICIEEFSPNSGQICVTCGVRWCTNCHSRMKASGQIYQCPQCRSYSPSITIGVKYVASITTESNHDETSDSDEDEDEEIEPAVCGSAASTDKKENMAEKCDDKSASEEFVEACRRGFLDVAKYLFPKADIHPDHGTCNGWTPLWIAVEHGHLNIVQWLVLEAKIDNYSHATSIAASNNHLDVVEFLLKHNTAWGVYAWGSSGYALNNIEGIKLFLKYGADIHFCHDAALHVAVEKDRYDIVKTLIEAGANVHARNNRALRLAAHKGNTNMAEFLIKAGADANDALEHERSDCYKQ